MNLREEIEALKTKLAELENKLEVEEKEPELWKPCFGEPYYYVPSIGGVGRTDFRDWEVGRLQIANFNFFGTEEEANKRGKWLRAINELCYLAEQLNEGWEPDWDDTNTPKWTLFFHLGGSDWGVKCTYRNPLGLPCFKNPSAASNALERLSDEAKETLKEGYY